MMTASGYIYMYVLIRHHVLSNSNIIVIVGVVFTHRHAYPFFSLFLFFALDMIMGVQIYVSRDLIDLRVSLCVCVCGVWCVYLLTSHQRRGNQQRHHDPFHPSPKVTHSLWIKDDHVFSGQLMTMYFCLLSGEFVGEGVCHICSPWIHPQPLITPTYRHHIFTKNKINKKYFFDTIRVSHPN